MTWYEILIIVAACLIVVGVIVFSSKSFMTYVNKYNGQKSAVAAQEQPADVDAEAEQK